MLFATGLLPANTAIPDRQTTATPMSITGVAVTIAGVPSQVTFLAFGDDRSLPPAGPPVAVHN
jgi:hypothetical protein